VAASALAMDKWRTKLAWIAAGIPTPAFRVVSADTDWMQLVAELGLPLIVKPAREGSSFGITRVESVDHEELRRAYEAAAKLDPLVIVEEFIPGEEYTGAVLGQDALPLVKIVAPEGNYDFDHKYLSDATRYFCPSGLAEADEAAIRQVVRRAYEVIGARGWGRIDLMRRSDGSFHLLELNTSPGMTSHSLVPMAARAAGISYEDLCLRILADANLEGIR
jgi:D-alanine-D-alanine ligase